MHHRLPHITNPIKQGEREGGEMKQPDFTRARLSFPRRALHAVNVGSHLPDRKPAGTRARTAQILHELSTNNAIISSLPLSALMPVLFWIP